MNATRKIVSVTVILAMTSFQVMLFTKMSGVLNSLPYETPHTTNAWESIWSNYCILLKKVPYWTQLLKSLMLSRMPMAHTSGRISLIYRISGF
jgi:hypothetical protein